VIQAKFIFYLNPNPKYACRSMAESMFSVDINFIYTLVSLVQKESTQVHMQLPAIT